MKFQNYFLKSTIVTFTRGKMKGDILTQSSTSLCTRPAAPATLCFSGLEFWHHQAQGKIQKPFHDIKTPGIVHPWIVGAPFSGDRRSE